MRRWLGTWAASAAAQVYFVPPEIMATPTPLVGTVRHRLRISVGGGRIRLRLSNETGVVPLLVGGVSVGTLAQAASPSAESLRRVTFAGEANAVIPAGAPLLSDPIDLPVAALAELEVSVVYPQAFTPARSESVHWAQYVVDADQVMETALQGAVTIAVRPTVTAIAVEVQWRCGVIVCIGDSLTDGAGSRSGKFRSWTDILARRLHMRYGQDAPAVVNAGIGGNQLLGTLIGPPALARLERDVFATPGVTHLVVFQGINDIGVGARTIEGVMRPMVSAQALIAGYQQIITRAHERGIKVIGATLAPFRGSLFFLEEKEAVRLAVNQWIRASGEFDSVIDFDSVLRTERDASQLNPEFDSGDFMHPNALGQQALGDAVDLELFA